MMTTSMTTLVVKTAVVARKEVSKIDKLVPLLLIGLRSQPGLFLTIT